MIRRSDVFLGSRNTRLLASLDFYAKVPVDLLEGSRQGNIISIMALFIIVILFAQETLDWRTPRKVSDLQLDVSPPVFKNKIQQGDPQLSLDEMLDKIEVRFNITMMDLKCEYATINVVSVLGNQQNITKDISRWNLDAAGVQQQYAFRNPDQHDIIHYDKTVTESLERLHENGEDALSLDPQTFYYALEDFDFVFVDFYASWCSHCQRLAPTWEKLAEVMHDASDRFIYHEGDYEKSEYDLAKSLEMPVLIAKIDCVEYEEFCQEQGVNAYPSLILYTAGDEKKGGEYRGDRTVLSFIQALVTKETSLHWNSQVMSALQEHSDAAIKKHLNITRDHADWLAAMDRSRRHQKTTWDAHEHPGCMLAGTLHLNRVPGRFYIQAEGAAAGHNLEPHMTNLSHVIHHLSFRNLYNNVKFQHEVLPDNFESVIHPFNGNVYINYDFHEAYSHYIKLVSVSSRHYQVIQNSQLSFYAEDRVPETKFILDISPIAVRYRIVRRPWYDYLTSVFAIVGGTFTVVGMLDAILRFTSRRFSRQKSSSAKQHQRVAP